MKYSLEGIDGNAFSVVGYVIKCMRKEGKTEEEISKFRKNAMSKDYGYLLMICGDMIEELNNGT